jgi:lipopolysaccharide/colanic/teichoic acid biosynthesis glycosyltransferase
MSDPGSMRVRLERRRESPPSQRRLVQIAPSQPRLRNGKRCETPAPKRFLDVFAALFGVIFGFPVLCLIGVAIALESRGPILYSQERVGLKGRTYRMYKFRSMVVDAERESGPVWCRENDPRVTRVGSILRQTHLDELPQLLNVLRGEMSIVGPRPERPAMVERLTETVPGYHERWAVLPGITGLAQVRHVYDQSTKTVRQKLRYDRCYIRRRGSFAVDLKIMAATVVLMIGGGPRKSSPATLTLRRPPALTSGRVLAAKEALSKP